jgi:hypothetical protein
MELRLRTGKENRTDKIFAHPDCQKLFDMPDYYEQVGYNPPWVGYFINKKRTGCWLLWFYWTT